ncbi:MAG: HD family phosphohydrolase [Nitrospinaceae bacterium]|nr:MAG: HD family phosphohydrolase [Nitrospinaceae bacterium]
MTSSKIDEFITREGLPSLPGQILSLLDELGNTSAMDYTILQKIQYDPAIAFQVLKVANTPLYGYAGKISSLQQAAGLLGPGAIRNIILTTPILERYQDDIFPPPFDHSRLWLHMSVTAALAGSLGLRLGKIETDVCFTAGLIHGIGKISLAACHPELLKGWVELAESEQTELMEIEKRDLGFTHADLGVEMVEAFGFPEELIRAQRFCYASKEDEVLDPLGGTVCVARNLANRWGYSDGIGNETPVEMDKLFLLLNFTEAELEEWIPQLLENVDLVVQTQEE